MTDAYDRVVVGQYSDGRNMVINKRTQAMLEVADYRLPFSFRLSQGSYNTSVAASGGTHSGGGVIDVSVSDLTSTQESQLLSVFRSGGFYAWLRTPSQGDWPYHIHAVAKGDAEASSAAKQQMVDAEAGYNGLRSHLYDGLNLNVSTFDYEGYKTLLDNILNRLAVLEGRVASNTDARAQYAYGQVQAAGPTGNLYDLVHLIDGRVEYNTNARAQAAYASVSGGAVSQSLAGLQSDVDNLNAATEALRSTDAGLTAAITNLKASDVTLSQAFADLKAQVDALPKA